MSFDRPLPLWMRSVSGFLAVIVPLNYGPVSWAQALSSPTSNDPVPLTGKPLPDAYSRDWTPPAPVFTAADLKLNEAPVVTPPHFEIPAGLVMTTEALVKSRVLETPLVYTAETDPSEAELARITDALRAHQAAGGVSAVDGRTRLAAVLAANPSSGFALSFQVEAAESAWRNGFFTNGLDFLRNAWASGSALTDPDAVAVAELALARLAERLSLLGKKDELRALLNSVKERQMGGRTLEAITKATTVLWFLDNRAERNLFCGYSAANAVCVPLGKRPVLPDVDDEAEKERFIRDGLSAYDLKMAGEEVGSPLRVIKRGAGAAVVVPSVIHWGYQHYSALVQKDEERGLYRVQDEHVGFDNWVPQAAIDEEGSGCFLIPADADIPTGYTEATDDEAKTFRGRHCQHGIDPEGNKCTTGCSGGAPMAGYRFDRFSASLLVSDTPIVHQPPYGPGLNIVLTYDQRSNIIPDTQNYTNIGRRWTLGMLEYVTITNSSTANTAPSTTAVWRQGSGEYYNYTLPTTTGATTYNVKFKERPRLVYAPKTGTMTSASYTLVFPDGSKKIFSQPDAASPSKFFLKQIVDVFGNALVLNYDSALRITSLQSVLPSVTLTTTFSYTPAAGDGVPTDTFKVRNITDPYGRTAYLTYTAAGLLETITDPVGIVSRFRYSAGDIMDRLITPYGTTQFRSGSTPGINSQPGYFAEATDPNGDRERVENSDYGLPDTYDEPAAIKPTNPQTITVAGTAVTFMPKNYNLFWRNSFHWDKKQMAESGVDYTKATIFNWLTSTSDTTTPVPASSKAPLESRVWYNYPGQLSESSIGTVGHPSKILRAIEGPTGTTTWQLSQTDYNDWGKPTRSVDPDGREVSYTYDATGLDLLQIAAKNGAATVPMGSATYHSVAGSSTHLPLTVTKADGTTGTYTYNSKGQPLTVTTSGGGNSLTTRYTYNIADPSLAGATCGWLIKTETTSPSNPAQFVTTAEITAYDAAKRPRTVKDAQGYMLTYDYDTIDRVTVVTHPDGTTEQTNYTQDGKKLLQPTATKDRAGRWTRTRYNGIGQPIVVIDPAMHGTTYDWCKCGALSRLTDPMGKVTFWKRDLQGRVTYKEMSDGKRYNYTYQPLSGRLGSVAFPNDVDASLFTFTNSYALSGQLLKKDYRDPAMADVTFAYADYLGRVTSMSDGLGNTSYTYNPFTPATLGAGQLATVNGPFTHDTLRYSYDWLGRAFKTEVLKDDGTTVTRTELATFDALGRAATLTNNLGSFTSTYAAGNLSSVPDGVALPGGYSSTYTRHPLSAATPANAALNQGNALRLASITHKDAANTTLQNHGYQYNLDGDITAWTQNTRRWDLQYDALGELTQQSTTLLATNALEEKRTWAYDAAGNMLSRTTEQDSNKSMELRQHSGRNQLTTVGGGGRTLVDGTVDEPASVTVQVGSTAAAQPARVTSQSPSGPYRFQREADFPVGWTSLTITATDGNNNISTKTYNVSVSDAETRSLAYDSNGNLKTKTYLRSGTAYRVESYTWDAENRLTGWQDKTLTTPTAPEIITASSTWQYDGQGRRVKEHNVQGATTTDKNILWSGLEMIQWQNPDGSVARNLFATGEQQPTSSLQPQASSLIYLSDHLGSIRSWYNPADNTKGSADYSAYGTRTITANTTSFTPARSFTGHYLHEASGLVLAPYRAYDAELGRWISEDPIAERGGVNLYGYVGNSVTIYRDPDGKLLVGAGIGAAFGAFTGGLGAFAQGGNAKDILIGAALGAAAGAVVGLLDPTEGALTIGNMAIIAGVSGSLGDMTGQLFASRNKPCAKINLGEIAGAGIGSAVGAAMGGVLAAGAVGAGASEIMANTVGGMIGMAPSTLGAAIGQGFGPTMSISPNSVPSFSF